MTQNTETLRSALSQRLATWQDFDIAAYELGVVLGIFEDDPEQTRDSFRKHKGIFWADNVLGNALHELLQQLVKLGFLEQREGPVYRWLNVCCEHSMAMHSDAGCLGAGTEPAVFEPGCEPEDASEWRKVCPCTSTGVRAKPTVADRDL